MTDAVAQFREEIQQFLDKKGMTPTAFGKAALNDPKFVFDLADGRSPSLGTVARVRAFMQNEAA